MQSHGSLPPPAPATADFLEYHAATSPRGVALFNNGRYFTYGEFYRDLNLFTRELGKLGLAPRSNVAVGCADFYLHWLLVLACESLGFTTGSFLAHEGSDAAALLNHVDLVLCEAEIPGCKYKRWHRVTQEWVNAVFSEKNHESIHRTPMNRNETLRIRRSSGSTGDKKLMIVSRGAEEARFQDYHFIRGFSKSSRLLATTTFTVGLIYTHANGCLRAGGTIIYDPQPSVIEAIEKHQPSHVWLLPHRLMQVLESLPEHYVKPPNLTVMTGSAPLPKELAQRSARLATSIVNCYSLNECGIIAILNDEGICTVCPGVEVEIIDEDGMPAAFGAIGRIRTRTNGMFDGYLGQAASPFRDGWYHTDDYGTFVGHRQMKIVGRVDEMLNIGGIKIAPATIEDGLLKSAVIKDAAVTSATNAKGTDDLWVAIVLDDFANLETAKADIGKLVRERAWGFASIAVLEEIPRTKEGKIQRHKLKAIISQSQNRPKVQ